MQQKNQQQFHQSTSIDDEQQNLKIQNQIKLTEVNNNYNTSKIGLICITIAIIVLINYNTYTKVYNKNHNENEENNQNNITIKNNINDNLTLYQRWVKNIQKQQENIKKIVINRTKLGQSKQNNKNMKLYVLTNKNKINININVNSFCIVINALNILTQNVYTTIDNLINVGKIQKILIYSNIQQQQTKIRNKLNQIIIKNINQNQNNTAQNVENIKLQQHIVQISAQYNFIIPYVNKCIAISYFQQSIKFPQQKQIHKLVQQMSKNKQLSISYSTQCLQKQTNQTQYNIKQLAKLQNIDLSNLTLQQISHYIYIFDPRLLHIVTPLNFVYYAKYNLQQLIILPILSMLQFSNSLLPFSSSISLQYQCNKFYVFKQFNLTNLKKNNKYNSSLCFVSYPSNPYKINKQQFDKYIQSIQKINFNKISANIIIYLPYIFSDNIDNKQSLRYYGFKLLQLKSIKQIKSIKLRILYNKTMANYAVYDAVYSYCQSNAIIISSRHNVIFYQNFVEKIITEIQQKYHYYYANYQKIENIVSRNTKRLVSFDKKLRYKGAYQVRSNPNIFRSHFQDLQIFKSDLMKSVLFWVLKSAQLQFYETQATFFTFMMECIRLNIKYINITLFQVAQRQQTQNQQKQINNIKKYVQFTQLPNNKLMPYQYNCLQNQAYRKYALDKIPKKIHQIWIGNNPISKIRMKLHETIKINNPTYKIYLWKDINLTKQNFPLTEYLIKRTLQYQQNSKRNYNAMIADLLRYQILYRHGGIYIDFKMQVLKSLDKFLKYEIFFIDGGSDNSRYPVPSTVGVGIMGAMQNSYYFGLILKELIRQKNINYKQQYIPGMTGGVIARKAFNDQQLFTVVGFGQHLFIPRPSYGDINDCGKVRSFGVDQQIFQIIDAKTNQKYQIGIPCKQYPQAYILSYKPLAATWKGDKNRNFN